MGLCPEAGTRAAMTDGEFWDHVAMQLGVGCPPDQDDDADEVQAVADLTPCAECGELGPCAYDDQGRALVHLVPDNDSEDG